MSDNPAPSLPHNANRRVRGTHSRSDPSQPQMLEHDGRDTRGTSNPNPNLNPQLPPYGNWAPIPPGMLPIPSNNLNPHPVPPPFLPGFNPYAPFPLPPHPPHPPPVSTHNSNLDPNNALEQWRYYASSATGNTASSPPNTNDMNRNYAQSNSRGYVYPNSAQNRQQSGGSAGRSSNYPPANNTNHVHNYNRAGGGGAARNNSIPSPRSRAHSTSQSNPTRLGAIPEVRDALLRFTDDSHIMLRFAQFCADSNRGIAPNRRRAIIHDFSGFQRNVRPRIEVLMYLNKHDLDTLGWALGVPRGGRKSDVASRISDSMKAPLRWRSPLANTADPTPNTMIANANGTSYSASAYGSNIPAPLNNLNAGRGNMPAIPQSAAYGARNRVPMRRRGAKDIQTIVKESDYMNPEIPFNIPLGKPLGDPGRMMFTSVQLSNGMVEPKVAFMTPNLEELETAMNTKGKGVLQVHLRCLKVETAKPVDQWKQSWPFPAAAKVNGSNVELDQAQRFTNGKLAGTDKATNITPFLRKRRDGHALNVVTLRRNANSCATTSGTFVFFAQPILVRSTATMAEIVKQNSANFWAEYRRNELRKGMKPNATDFEMGRRQVAELMSGGDDFAVSSQKVSLKCPLSLVPISTPVRGKDCTHIQCFDLTNYLDFTRRSTKFNCPVCNKKDASPSSLIISWFIDEALKKYAGCDEVEVLSDGSIKAVQNVRTGVASNDSDTDDDMPVRKKPKTESAGATNGKGSKPVEIISLDSDDDEPPGGGATGPSGNTAPPAATPVAQPQPPQLSPPPPAAIHQTQQRAPLDDIFNDTANEFNDDNEDGDEGDFDVEFKFDADDSVYPWDIGDLEERREDSVQSPASEPQAHAPEPNGQSANNGPVFENGIEVITIDSD